MAVAPIAVAAPASKLPPAVAQALASGNYNQVQQALTDALNGKKISPESPQVLGVQANLWAEHIRTPERLFHMAFPRAEVLAEKWLKVDCQLTSDY